MARTEVHFMAFSLPLEGEGRGGGVRRWLGRAPGGALPHPLIPSPSGRGKLVRRHSSRGQNHLGLRLLARPALRRAAGGEAGGVLLRGGIAGGGALELAQRVGDVGFGFGDELVVVLVERQADAVDLRPAPAIERDDDQAVARE